jgi:hypothetical protein
MKTVNQLFYKALSYVGAYGSGQVPSSEDIQLCNDAFRPLLEELAVTDVAYIPVNPSSNNTQEIPDGLFLSLAKLLAIEIAPDYGAPVDEMAREYVLRRIRLIASAGSYGQTQEAEYF